MTTLCRRGLHDLDKPENTYLNANGSERFCRPCNIVTQREWRKANPDKIRKTRDKRRAENTGRYGKPRKKKSGHKR